MQNELLIKNCTTEETEKLIKITKEVAERKGPMNEMPPFDEWLNSILKIFKG